ncbi:MAG: hypothetical protein KGJ23_09305 [Euryarchaeota archaeon]|nr:hypothetical protein [Euryarchaeota archaeon]MDE1836801.1 hypothetical protein [Euryarchaeota archaeon]MDE1881118.1 hypothetical protein [Euryarchaeota archaeon]MDE2044785.1 hypothetical protein [Thermoplasmata archaeon]
MPLFGHQNQPATPLRQNEHVLGQWKTHHGEFHLTDQRCFLMKGGGIGGLGGHHEVSWGVDLEAIQDAQVVDGNPNAASQAAGNAAGNAASDYSPIGNPFSNLGGQAPANLVINGQSIAFHDPNTANQALTQIQSARQTRLQQLGQS